MDPLEQQDRFWFWEGRRRREGRGEEGVEEWHNSTGRCGDLRESDSCQTEPEPGAGGAEELLNVPRRRTPSSGAMRSACGGAVELGARGVGVG